MKERLINSIKSTAVGRRALADKTFRAVLLACVSMGWNLICAIFNGVLGIVYRSAWFASMSAYHAVLGLMRLSVVFRDLRWKGSADRRTVMRRIGIGFIILAAVTAAIVFLTISEVHNRRYGLILMIAVAAYTFFSVAATVVKFVRTDRRRISSVIMLRSISCAAAAGSLLSLERSMLGTFGSASDGFTYIIEGASGLAAVLFIMILGASMIRLSYRRREERKKTE